MWIYSEKTFKSFNSDSDYTISPSICLVRWWFLLLNISASISFEDLVTESSRCVVVVGLCSSSLVIAVEGISVSLSSFLILEVVTLLDMVTWTSRTAIIQITEASFNILTLWPLMLLFSLSSFPSAALVNHDWTGLSHRSEAFNSLTRVRLSQ